MKLAKMLAHICARSHYPVNIAKNKVEVSRRVLMSFIGVSMRQIHLALTKASYLIKNNEVIGTLDRQLRKDFIRVKLEPHLYSFLLDDDYIRLDTNQGLVEVSDPISGKEITEHKRIWLIVNKEQQHSLFLSSDQYVKFQQEHNGASTSYGIWYYVMGKVESIVSNPKPESFVDEKTSGLQHMMAAILGIIKEAPVKAYLKGYHNDGEGLMYDDLYSVLCKAGCFRMVDTMCWGKVEQPQLHFDKTKPCPKMVWLRCFHAPLGPAPPCELCGFKRLRILDVMEREFANKEVDVMV